MFFLHPWGSWYFADFHVRSVVKPFLDVFSGFPEGFWGKSPPTETLVETAMATGLGVGERGCVALEIG